MARTKTTGGQVMHLGVAKDEHRGAEGKVADCVESCREDVAHAGDEHRLRGPAASGHGEHGHRYQGAEYARQAQFFGVPPGKEPRKGYGGSEPRTVLGIQLAAAFRDYRRACGCQRDNPESPSESVVEVSEGGVCRNAKQRGGQKHNAGNGCSAGGGDGGGWS
jgi:hypothetical protein